MVTPEFPKGSSFIRRLVWQIRHGSRHVIFHKIKVELRNPHKWPLLPHREGKDKNSILSRAQFIEYPLNSSASISAELKLGEACIFNHKIVHSSGVNVSGNRRIGLLIDCIPTSAVKKVGHVTALC